MPYKSIYFYSFAHLPYGWTGPRSLEYVLHLSFYFSSYIICVVSVAEQSLIFVNSLFFVNKYYANKKHVLMWNNCVCVTCFHLSTEGNSRPLNTNARGHSRENNRDVYNTPFLSQDLSRINTNKFVLFMYIYRHKPHSNTYTPRWYRESFTSSIN